jgi:hypothetical protein
MFNDDKSVAQSTAQVGHAVATTNAQHIAADQAYYTALILAGRKWGITVNARQALTNLGGQPPAGSWQPTD